MSSHPVRSADGLGGPAGGSGDVGPPPPDRGPHGGPSPGTAAAVAVAVGAVFLIQLRAGLLLEPLLVTALGLFLTAAAPVVAVAWPGGRGVPPAIGLCAAAVTQALVVVSDDAGVLVVLMLGLWLPSAAVALALADEDQRARSASLAAGGPRSPDRSARGRAHPAGAASGEGIGSRRPWRSPVGDLRPAPGGRARAVRSALAAGAVVAVVAVVASALIRPPGLRDGSGRNGGDAGDVARAGRTPTTLGIYQSAEQLDTGRRFELSDEVVLRVRAEAADFWRGTSYDAWDGRVWTRTGPGAEAEGDVGAVEADTLVQTFTVVAGGSDLLFGAYRPVQHVALPTRPRVEADGTATVAWALGPGARYRVVSRRPIVTEDVLRRADPLAAAVPAELAARYLALPDVPRRVRRLAAEVTAGSVTAYDKIRALEAWLGENTTYTLDIPPLPEGADAVEQFLFVDRRGYCEQIASSLAVMLRSVGVPARLGVGYAPGERRWGSDEFVVRGRDAHAWVEVWFPGLGWQAFDPTAEVPLSGEDGGSGVGRFGGWLVAAAAAGAALAARLLVRRWRRRRAEQWEASVLARLEQAGRRRGRPRRSAETASEYARVLADDVLVAPGLHEVAGALERAIFGPPPGGVEQQRRRAEERRRIESLVDEAIAAAPRPPHRKSVDVLSR